MFFRTLFLSLALCMGIFSKGFSTEIPPEYLVLTVPKSGSHLMGKLIRMLKETTGETFAHHDAHLYYQAHPFGMQPKVRLYNKTAKKLILIRDPRDIVVSAAFWFTKHHKNHKQWQRLNLNQKIETVINETMDFPFAFITKSFDMIDVYLNAGPECLIVKFENLIGPKGGGSLENQTTEIYKIANFLNIELTPTEMDYIVENLHGLRQEDMIGVQTFRKGKIDQWRECFTPHHERLFNAKFYYLLERWDYLD